MKLASDSIIILAFPQFLYPGRHFWPWEKTHTEALSVSQTLGCLQFLWHQQEEFDSHWSRWFGRRRFSSLRYRTYHMPSFPPLSLYGSPAFTSNQCPIIVSPNGSCWPHMAFVFVSLGTSSPQRCEWYQDHVPLHRDQYINRYRRCVWKSQYSTMQLQTRQIALSRLTYICRPSWRHVQDQTVQLRLTCLNPWIFVDT